MMKNYSFSLLLLIVLFNTNADAQLFVDIESEEYASLADATVWLENEDFDSDALLVPSLGFPFEFREENFVGINITTEGIAYFDEGGVLGFIFVLSNDLIDRDSQSVISYKLEGDIGNRIFKIEWENMGLKCGSEGDFLNFQLWVLEDECNKLEFHFGESSSTNSSYCEGATGPSVGFLFQGDFTATASGNPLNPTWTSSQNATLSIPPPEGTIYRFRECETTATNDLALENGIKIYPNPTEDRVNITFENMQVGGKEAKITIYDLFGNKVLKKTSIGTNDAGFGISLKEIPPGMYILKLTLDGQTITEKIIKE